MESLYLLIPLSVLTVAVAVLVFFWMNRDGQFDDDQGPAWSILLDDDRPIQTPDEGQQNVDATMNDNLPSTAEQAKGQSNDPPSTRHEP